MTAIPELRAFLFENGFFIDREDAVLEDDKIYSVMSVRYIGENIKYNPEEIYMGKILPASENSVKYCEKVLAQLNNRLKGLLHRGEAIEAEKITGIISAITEKYLS